MKVSIEFSEFLCACFSCQLIWFVFLLTSWNVGAGMVGYKAQSKEQDNEVNFLDCHWLWDGSLWRWHWSFGQRLCCWSQFKGTVWFCFQYLWIIKLMCRPLCIGILALQYWCLLIYQFILSDIGQYMAILERSQLHIFVFNFSRWHVHFGGSISGQT